MDLNKVFVVLSHCSDSNSHFTNTSVCFVTCIKSSAENVISIYEKNYSNTSFEIVETELYDWDKLLENYSPVPDDMVLLPIEVNNTLVD